MPDWDSPNLLARLQQYLRRPLNDNTLTATTLYSLLTEAEAKWLPVLAQHAPGPMLGPPVKLTSNDGGITYQFPGNKQYIYVEIYPSLTGPPLVPGPYWSYEHDFVLEGDRIRMCRNQPRSFADGPYLRGIASPGPIDAATQSQIKPEHHRIVLVYHAAKLWATISSSRDPAFFDSLLQQALYGDPDIPGDIGILGQSKLRSPHHGKPGGTYVPWWMPDQ